MSEPDAPTNKEEDEYAAYALLEEGRYKEAFEKYRPLAELGSLIAQINLGWMYHKGRGIPQDFEAAERWYRRAEGSNPPEGQFYLGTLYRTQKQYERALECFERSASQDFMPALHALGKMYNTGQGVDIDKAKAYSYFAQAAQRGHLPSKREIAVQMMKGHHGVACIPQGVYRFIRIFWPALQLFWKDPADERGRW